MTNRSMLDGKMSSHRLFEVENRDIHEHRGLNGVGDFCEPRLWDLYSRVLKYI